MALWALLATICALFVASRGSPSRVLGWAGIGDDGDAEPTGSPAAVAMARAGRRLTRAAPPKFLHLAPGQAKVRTIPEVAEENPELMGGFREALFKDRERDQKGANLCAWEFMNRKPAFRTKGIDGKMAVTLTVAGGKGRVARIQGLEGSDTDPLFVDCYAGATSWASDEWAVGGADGTWTILWPYHFGPAEAAS